MCMHLIMLSMAMHLILLEGSRLGLASSWPAQQPNNRELTCRALGSLLLARHWPLALITVWIIGGSLALAIFATHTWPLVACDTRSRRRIAGSVQWRWLPATAAPRSHRWTTPLLGLIFISLMPSTDRSEGRPATDCSAAAPARPPAWAQLCQLSGAQPQFTTQNLHCAGGTCHLSGGTGMRCARVTPGVAQSCELAFSSWGGSQRRWRSRWRVQCRWRHGSGGGQAWWSG